MADILLSEDEEKIGYATSPAYLKEIIVELTATAMEAVTQEHILNTIRLTRSESQQRGCTRKN